VSKKNKGALGPVPDARPELGPARGRARAYHSNGARPGVVGSGPLADSVRGHPGGGVTQLAQAHPFTGQPVPGLAPVDTPQHVNYQPPTAPQCAAELTLQVPHGRAGNALYTDAYGQAPTVVVEQVRADQASTDLPTSVRAAPGAAAGLAGPEFHQDYGTARTNPELPAGETPVRPGGAVHHLRREPGELQGYGPDVRPPGYEWATRAPGDGYSAAGGYSDGRR
jgi:hypothetical protein